MKIPSLFLALAAACGGGTGPGVGVSTGTVAGASLNVVEGSALITTIACGTDSPRSLINVDLASRPGVCAGTRAGTVPGSLTELNILMERFFLGAGSAPATTPAIAAGTYNIGTSQQDSAGFAVGVAAFFSATDAACGVTLIAGVEQAQTGAVTITGVSDGGVAGTFHFTFPDGSLTGTFDVPACVLTTAQLCAGGGVTCSG